MNSRFAVLREESFSSDESNEKIDQDVVQPDPDPPPLKRQHQDGRWTVYKRFDTSRFVSSMMSNPRVVCGNCSRTLQIKRGTVLAQKAIAKAERDGQKWRISRWECPHCYKEFEDVLEEAQSKVSTSPEQKDNAIKQMTEGIVGFELNSDLLQTIEDAADTRAMFFRKRIFDKREIEARAKVTQQWDYVDKLRDSGQDVPQDELDKLNYLRTKLTNIRSQIYRH